MYHTSSLLPGSGGSSKGDGLKTGSGSGGGKELELSGGKGGAGGEIFLKSAGGGVSEGAIGSNSCRSGAGPSNVVEKATGIHFLKMSSFSIGERWSLSFH